MDSGDWTNETQGVDHAHSQSTARHGSVLLGHGSRSGTKSVQIKSTPPKQAVARHSTSDRNVDTTVALLEGIYSCSTAPGSPTSMSLFMVDKLLGSTAADSSSGSSPDSAPAGDVPFECLQYFKYLNSAARRLVKRHNVSSSLIKLSFVLSGA